MGAAKHRSLRQRLIFILSNGLILWAMVIGLATTVQPGPAIAAASSSAPDALTWGLAALAAGITLLLVAGRLLRAARR